MNINSIPHIRVFLFPKGDTETEHGKLMESVALHALKVRDHGGLLEWWSEAGFVLHLDLHASSMRTLLEILVCSGLSSLENIGFIAEADPPKALRQFWDGEFAEGDCLSELVEHCKDSLNCS